MLGRVLPLLFALALGLFSLGCHQPLHRTATAAPPVYSAPPAPPPSLAVVAAKVDKPPSLDVIVSKDRRIALPGGAQLLFEPDRLANTVAMTVFMAVGSADEPQPGTRHLLERLLLDGQAPWGTFVARLRARGSQVVSFTAPDYTVYQVVTPRPLWTFALELLRQLFAELPASAAVAPAFMSQRQQVLLELADPKKDGPALRKLLGTMYPGHPYQPSLLGTAESLNRLQAEDLRAFHRLHYQPARLTVVVVGDLDEPEVVGRLSAQLAALPAIGSSASLGPQSTAAPRSYIELAQKPAPGPQVTIVEDPAAAPQGLLGFRLPPQSAADLPALEAAMILLGENPPAALHAGAPRRSFLVNGRAPGIFVVQAVAPSSSSVNAVMQSALAAALRLGQHQVRPIDLVSAQHQLLNMVAQRNETPASRSLRLGSLAMLGLDESAYEAALRQLSPHSLQAVLHRFLTPANLSVLLTGPSRGALEDARRHLLAQATALAAVPSSPQAVVNPAAPAVLYQMHNGARLVILPEPHKKAVAIAALWPGGIGLEDARNAGLHELLCRVWPRSEQRRMHGALNIDLEPHSESNSFGLRLKSTSADLPLVLSRLRDVLSQPFLNDGDLEEARQTLLLELGAKTHDAAYKEAEAARAAWRLFAATELGRHGDRFLPTEQSLGALTTRRLLDFYRHHYDPKQLVLAFVGDVSVAEVLAELEPWLGQAQPLPFAHSASTEVLGAASLKDQLSAPAQAFQFAPTEHAHLVLGFPAPGRNAFERSAVEVLLELLVGEEGRLRQTLLFRRGLAYTLLGQLSPGPGPGYLAFVLTAAPSQLESLDVTLRDELHKLIDHPANREEVAAARDRVLSRHLLRNPRPVDLAWRLAKAVALQLADRALWNKASDAETQLLAVDAAAVQAAAEKVLRFEKLVSAAVLPEALAPAIGRIPATRRPLFGILPPVWPIPTRYLTNATDVISRSAEPGNDRGNGTRPKRLSNGRGGRPLSGRLQSVSRHAAALRREARR